MKQVISIATLAVLAACSVPQGEPEAEPGATEEAVPLAEEATSSEASPEGEQEAPPAPPGTDIHTYLLTWADGVPSLGDPLVVVGTPGYDNQPYFVEPDESGSLYILYTSAGENGETDIWYSGLTNGDSWNVTETPTASEYSPRLQPGGFHSYIYQPPGGYAGHAYLEAYVDQSVDLTKEARPAHELAPVGYYVFSQDLRHVAVFALGEPNTLQLIDRSTSPETVTHIVDNPGRTLFKTPQGDVAWYSSADEDGNHTVSTLDFVTGASEVQFVLPAGSQDFVPMDMGDGNIGVFSTDEGSLVYRDSGSQWAAVADLEALGLSGVTRIAVSHDRSVVAIVAEE